MKAKVLFFFSISALVVSTAYTQPVLSIDFDEGSGTEVADSASGLTGVFGFATSPVEDNFPEFSADSPSGTDGDFSLMFDGNDLVTVNDPDGLLQPSGFAGGMTLEAYLKFEGVPGEDQPKSIIYAYGLPGGYAFSIAADRSLFTTTYGIADINPGNAIVPDDGAWHHAAVVFDGENVMFYVDGVLSDTAPSGLPNDTEFTRLFIGIEAVGEAPEELINPYLGMIDRVKITPSALSPNDFDIIGGVTSHATDWNLYQ